MRRRSRRTDRGSAAYFVDRFDGVILGVYSRWVSLALVPILLGSIYVPHGTAGFFFSNEGGGWEFPAFWAATLVVQSLLGDSAYALKRNHA